MQECFRRYLFVANLGARTGCTVKRTVTKVQTKEGNVPEKRRYEQADADAIHENNPGEKLEELKELQVKY